MSSSEPALISVCFQSFEQLQEIPYINDLLPKNPSAYSLEIHFIYCAYKVWTILTIIPEIAQKGLESIERDSLGGESEYFSERICQAAVERSLKNFDPVKVWIKGSGIPDFDQEIALFIDDQLESNKSPVIKEFMAGREGEEEKDSCIIAVTSEQMRLVYFLETEIISTCDLTS